MARSRPDDSFREFYGPGSPYLNPDSVSFGVVDRGLTARSFVAAGRRLHGELLRLTSDRAAGSLSLADFTSRARLAVRTAYFVVYSLGATSVFPFYTMTERDVQILDSELSAETGFLARFGRVLGPGAVDTIVRRRTALYVLALRGIFERGRLEAMPSGPYRWRLGITEHCDDCFRASLVTYQKDRFSNLGLPVLPGVPGDGSVCDGLTRCGCIFELASGVPVPGQDLALRMRELLLEVINGSTSSSRGSASG